MNRRRFLILPLGAPFLPALGNAAPTGPESVHRLAFFSWRGTCQASSVQDSLLTALREVGWSEGRNLTVQRYCAPVKEEAAPEAARALATSGAELVSVWGAYDVRLVQRATGAIPIAAFVDDAVAEGLTDAYRKPKGNVTGICLRHPDWERKSIEHLRLLVPQLKRLAIVGEGRPELGPTSLMRGVDAAAREAGLETSIRMAPLADFGHLFSELSREGFRAAYLWTRSAEASAPVVELATRQHIATFFLYPDAVDYGALMGYMVVNSRGETRMAAIVDKLLRGASTAEIPWELPDQSVLAINMRTAKMLGITIPPEIMLRADRVVE